MTTETSTTDSRHRAWSMMAAPVEAGAEVEPVLHPRVMGLRCRNCGRPQVAGPSYVCPACFGPLEVVLDRDVVRALVSRAAIEARAPGIWRYLELLPVEAAPERGLAVGSTPLAPTICSISVRN